MQKRLSCLEESHDGDFDGHLLQSLMFGEEYGQAPYRAREATLSVVVTSAAKTVAEHWHLIQSQTKPKTNASAQYVVFSWTRNLNQKNVAQVSGNCCFCPKRSRYLHQVAVVAWDRYGVLEVHVRVHGVNASAYA
jgi:hypothetical protein